MRKEYMIKKMAKIHCARGPKRCEQCKDWAKEKKYAVLDLNPQTNIQAARPMIEIEIKGKRKMAVFDVLAYFDTMEEAQKYAEKKDLPLSDKRE